MISWKPAFCTQKFLNQSGLGNEGGNLNLKRNMIRGAPSEGGEERAWEHLILGQVNESAVKPFQCRSAAFVGPNIFSVQKRQFDEVHVVDAVIEEFSFSMAKIGIILFMSIPNHIEIPTNDPGCTVGR
jgi:hypothetical protein